MKVKELDTYIRNDKGEWEVSSKIYFYLDNFAKIVHEDKDGYGLLMLKSDADYNQSSRIKVKDFFK